MSRFGTQKGLGPIGVILIFAAVLLLAGLAFYREPWVPHAPGTTTLATQEYELTEADNGKSFSYPVTSRFTVVLPGYPEPYCAPGGIVGRIASELPPRYRFEAVTPGSCTLVAGDWQVVIMVTGGPGQ